MKCAEQITPIEEPIESQSHSIIQLPLGLLGFEKIKNYTLLGSQEEAPFLWLQMVDDPSLSFLVVTPGDVPGGVLGDYQPDISDEDALFLELKGPDEAMVLNIVTMHAEGKATVNLKGPVVINRRTLRGKQVIPRNVSKFALQHPLLLSES